MRRRRCTGSGVSVGSSVIITETRFPKVPICSGVRTDTGMKPSSDSAGSSPRSSSHERSPAVQMASTTSLTVQPKVFLIIFTSSSDIDSNATRRCADIRRLKSRLGGDEAVSLQRRSGVVVLAGPA